jgi:hypothetical protein
VGPSYEAVWDVGSSIMRPSHFQKVGRPLRRRGQPARFGADFGQWLVSPLAGVQHNGIGETSAESVI